MSVMHDFTVVGLDETICRVISWYIQQNSSFWEKNERTPRDIIGYVTRLKTRCLEATVRGRGLFIRNEDIVYGQKE